MLQSFAPMGQEEIFGALWLLTLCAAGAFFNCRISILPHCHIAFMQIVLTFRNEKIL
jgi:hypothetical protein